MSNSILEQIAQNVYATIQGVTTTNGYNQTLSVAREARINTISPLKAIIYQDDPVADVEAESNNVQAWIQGFWVLVNIAPSDESASVAAVTNPIVADLHKALMQDPQRSGLANDTIIEPSIHLTDSNGALEGIWFIFSVKYRTRRGDPFTSAA